MDDKTINLSQLNQQMARLKDDETKTRDRLAQIMGATKVIQFLIDEITLTPIEEVNKNGN